MRPGHGSRGHSHDQGDDEDGGQWIQLLRPSEMRELLEIDRACKDVERHIIQGNQAKLAGRSEAERREWAPSGHRVGASAVRRRQEDVMSQLYSKHIEAKTLVKLLPGPGDGEKLRKVPSQEMVDLVMSFILGPLFGMATMLVTIGSVGVYLYETSIDERDDGTGGGGWYKTGHDYPFWFPFVECFLLAFFAVELGLRAVLADHDRTFWLSAEAAVDVLSLVPSVLFVAFGLRLWGFLRFLRLVRWADVATILNGRNWSRTTERGDNGAGSVDGTSGAGLAGLKLLAFVGRYVLVYAGFVTLLSRAEGGIEHLSEADPEEPIEFTSALYMAATMLSTVGEGVYEPVPMPPGARVAASIAVLVFLPLAAIRVADVIKCSRAARTPARAVALPTSVRERHVVMCGSINVANLKARLQELFHADHGNHNIRWVRVVVMSPNPPSPSLTALLDHPRYRGRVTFMQGSPLHDDSLLDARIDDADAVMILADKTPPSSHAEDMSLSLQAISVMTHVTLDRGQGNGPRILVELVDPNAALHLQAAGIEHVVSSAQVKLSVLAQSCLCPGWSAVVANLLESRAALPAQVLEQGSWLAEYYVGAKKTFYSVEFSPAFTGVLFADAVVHIFEYFELILVAVETKRHGRAGADGEYTVVVNPAGDHYIGKGDRGFLLAESQADARVIWDYMAEDGKGGAIDEGTGRLKERFTSPEEEEALAMETLGTAGVAGMGPEAFVDSMVFGRTLLHCQKKLPDRQPPDTGLLLEWARQFQASDGISDKDVVSQVLASAGLEPPGEVVRDTSTHDVNAAAVPTNQTATNRVFASALAKKPSNALTRGIKQERLSSPVALAAVAPDAIPAGTLRRPLRKAGAPGGPGARERFLSDVTDEDLRGLSPSSGNDDGFGVWPRGADGASAPCVGYAGGADSAMAAELAVYEPVPRPIRTSSARLSGERLSAEASADGSPQPADEEVKGQVKGQVNRTGNNERDGINVGGDGRGSDSSPAAGTTSNAAEGEPSRTSVTSSSDLLQPQPQQPDCSDSSGDARRSSSVHAEEMTTGFTIEDIMSELRTLEASSLTRDDAYNRLLTLCSAANAVPLPSRPGANDVRTTSAATTVAAATDTAAATNADTTNAPLVAGDGGVGDYSSSPTAAAAAAAAASAKTTVLPVNAIGSRRRVSTARHLVGHVVVVGFPARPSHLECFLRPLKGWTGGAGMGGGREVGGGVPVVLVADDVSKLESALEVVDKHGYVNTKEVYLFQGSPVSRTDLENAGVRTAKAVLVMKDSKGTRFKHGGSGDPLRDAEALVSFVKMEDGLLSQDQHVVVELESSANVRFLHARAEAKSLCAIIGLGGAGAGGAADEAHYLWPKFAAGMTYNSSFVDSMFGQAFYRPSRIALIERLLLLARGEQQRHSSIPSSSPLQTANEGQSRPRSASRGSSGAEEDELDGECCLRQMAVPPSLLGHSFGEMFQHLAAPPLRCVAFALLRARGTRNAPEPYVYTGPRADTVLHPGDRVFILGKPPVL